MVKGINGRCGCWMLRPFNLSLCGRWGLPSSSFSAREACCGSVQRPHYLHQHLQRQHSFRPRPTVYPFSIRTFTGVLQAEFSILDDWLEGGDGPMKSCWEEVSNRSIMFPSLANDRSHCYLRNDEAPDGSFGFDRSCPEGPCPVAEKIN